MGNVKMGRLSDPETGEDLNNVETALKGLDIQLRDSGDTFRNFGEVLDETAGRWDTFSNVQQHAIATAFAGKDKMNFLIHNARNYGDIIMCA
jgi:hypothetical protein